MSVTEPSIASALVILAEFSVPRADRAAFLAACADDARGSVSDEPGCRQFDVLAPEQTQADLPDIVTLLEVYDDAASFEAHLRTPHYARFKAAVQQLGLPAPNVRRLFRLHQGTAGGAA